MDSRWGEAAPHPSHRPAKVIQRKYPATAFLATQDFHNLFNRLGALLFSFSPHHVLVLKKQERDDGQRQDQANRNMLEKAWWLSDPPTTTPNTWTSVGQRIQHWAQLNSQHLVVSKIMLANWDQPLICAEHYPRSLCFQLPLHHFSSIVEPWWCSQ